MNKSMFVGACLLGLALSQATPAASAASPRMIGANIAGGDFGGSGAYPGVLGFDYWYPRANDIDMAKAIGIELVRVPFKWDRIQHDTEGVLDAALWAPDITALDNAINAMEARGMRIILDMHNYAGRSLTVAGVRTSYKIGAPELPASEFGRVWQLLADHYKDRPSIWGYDIMNEPVGVTTANWVTYCQTVVTAIRQVDMKTAIILEGAPSYAHTSGWLTLGAPLLAVSDPANNLIFSGHCYIDRDQSGTWSHGVSFDAELVGSGKPYADHASALNVGVDRVKPFVDWCVANNVRGLVGEYASPCKTDEANWNIATDNMLAYMTNNGNGLISGTQWSSGGISTGSQTRMQPRVDNSNPSLEQTILPNYVSGVGTNYWPSFTWYDESITTTADYSFAYSYPTANVTINAADTSGPFSGTKAINVHYTLPAATNGGGGLHTRGPLAVGAIGGVDISHSAVGNHVLSFYAKGASDAAVSVTLGKTSDATGVDGGSDTGTGNWISLSSIAPLTSTWQRYEIPLSSITNAQVTGTERVQRFRFTVGPADGVTRDVYFDKITIANPSTNTAPTVSVDTSTGGSTFSVGQSVTLVATASDPNAGDSIDYVEFYVDHQKVGIDDITPYQWTTTFAAAGTYSVTAIAFDSHGVATQSAVKTLTIVLPAPTGLSATAGNARVILNWSASSGATSYNVKRATVSGGPYTPIASPTTTTFTDTGLTNGTAYYYVVSAVNGSGESANSTQVTATPQSITLTLDNAAGSGVTFTGTWIASTATAGYYGTNYHHDNNAGATGGKKVRFTPTITTAGNYEVYVRWTAAANRATNAPIDVTHAGGTAPFTANQQLNNGTWISLGTFFFNTGTAGNVTVRNDAANGYVIADAVQLVLR